MAPESGTVEEKVGGDIVVKQEPGQPPKLSRSSSQKIVSRPPQLFSHLPDSTDDAKATFTQIEECWYANKYMGITEHAMECECAEEWGKFLYSFDSLSSSYFPWILKWEGREEGKGGWHCRVPSISGVP